MPKTSTKDDIGEERVRSTVPTKIDLRRLLKIEPTTAEQIRKLAYCRNHTHTHGAWC